jgi:hypothetical protein
LPILPILFLLYIRDICRTRLDTFAFSYIDDICIGASAMLTKKLKKILKRTAKVKRPRVAELTASRSAFLKSQLEAAVKRVEEHLSDEYEQWRRLPAIKEDDPIALNPLKY